MGWFTLAGKLANQRTFNAKDKIKSCLNLLGRQYNVVNSFMLSSTIKIFPIITLQKPIYRFSIMFIIFHDENTQLYLLKYAHFVPTIKLSTTSVPRGKVRTPLWTHPLTQYLNMPPIKLPIPIISHGGIYSSFHMIKNLHQTIICRLIGPFYAILFQTNIVVSQSCLKSPFFRFDYFALPPRYDPYFNVFNDWSN